MKKVDPKLLKVFFYGLPVVIILAVYSYCYSYRSISSAAGYLKLLNSFAGLIFALWMMLAIYCPLRGMGEKPSPLGEDFSRLAVLWETTARPLIPFTI